MSASASRSYDSTASGHVYAFVGYGATPITLSILRDGRDVTDPLPAKDVYVGERMRLAAQITPDGLPINSRNQRWSVPGMKFADWVAGLPTGAVIQVDDILDQSSVNFCWITAAGAEPNTTTVTVTYTVPLDTIILTARAKFNVIRPPASLNGTVQSEVELSEGWQPDPNEPTLHFGYDRPPNAAPGIDFHNSAPTGDGDFQLVQTGTQSIKVELPDGSWYKNFPDHGLDAGDFNTWQYPFIDPGHTEAVDLPGLSLAPLLAASVNDSFSMYLMFKPLNVDGAYVPIKMLNWGWSGSVSRPDVNTDWLTQSVTSPSHTPTTPNIPTEGTYTTAHPTWFSYVTNTNRNWIATSPPP